MIGFRNFIVSPRFYKQFAIILSVTALLACQQADDSVENSAARQNAVQAISVTVARAQTRVLNEPISVTGVLEAFKKATVAAEVAGQILQRHVEAGDSVKKGQALVTIDPTLLRQRNREMQANVASRKVAVASARNELKRGEDLVKKAFISKDELENLEFAVQNAEAQLQAALAAKASASESLNDTRVSAPFDGLVEGIHVQQGDYINPGNPIATVADFSRMRVRAGVTAAQAQQFVIGAESRLAIEDAYGEEYTGKVHSVGRIADSTTGAYPMEIWLDGEQVRSLRDGMVANITVEETSEQEALMVPSAAVFRRDGAHRVFVVVETDTGAQAQLRSIRAGRRTTQFTQVVSGLSLGEQVVIDGQFALRDGASVTF
ncbi:MAG: efflux RND transporter periplasmic adaptor subunit [Pseudomonadota bacterium]